MSKVLLVIFTTLSALVAAQTVKFGVTGAVNKGSIVGVHGVSEAGWGGVVGAFTSISLVENDVFDSAWLYLQPQLEFSKQGERGAWDDVMENGKETYDMGYIAVPIYIKYFLTSNGVKKDIFFFAGPKFEYLVFNKVKEGNAIQEVTDAGIDPTLFGLGQRFNTFGYGISFGAGLRIGTQSEAFLRYDRGFSKVYPDYTHRNTYTRYIALGINYYLTDIR